MLSSSSPLRPLLLKHLTQLATASASAAPLSTAACSCLHASSCLPHAPSDARQQQPHATLGLPMQHGHQHRSFASGPPPSSEVTTTTLAEGENTWTKFRAAGGVEQKSSLGPAMYMMIGVFGFSMYLNDFIYQPPRVATMVGLMMLLLYVRR